MKKIPRPPVWLLVLSFGIALYYLVPVLQEWLREDWRETPVLEIGTAKEPVAGGGYVDVTGRRRAAPTRSRSFVTYQYQVAGERFYGTWRWGGQPAEPFTVLYDPDASHRSVLKTVPTSTAGRFVGWLWLGIGGLALVLRLAMPAPTADDETPEVAADVRRPLPDRKQRKLFRLLVLVDLAVWVALWNAPSWYDRAPVDLLESLQEAFPPLSVGADGFFAESSSLVYALSILASLGLLAFRRSARTVYAATWLFWIAYGLLGSASVHHGTEGMLSGVGRLLGGAILALSTVGPIARAFEAGSGRSE